MKKRIKRNNYILFGAIAVAAVALSGVGFATWITGMVKDTDSTSETTVEIDTATNDTMYLDVELDSSDASIRVSENANDAGNGKLYSSGKAADLTFKFKKFRLVYSEKYNNLNPVVKMSVSFKKDNSVVSSLTCANGKIAKSSKDSYLNFPSTFIGVENGVVFAEATPEKDEIDGYTVKVLSTNEITFSWGELFGNKSPITYYNERIDGISSTASIDPLKDKLAIMSEATTTLNEMNTNLNGVTMTLTFTASWTGKSI